MFNVLVIDDTKAVHAYLKSILSKTPEIVLHGVFNGAEAVERLKKETNFDLILLDWEMPVMNGPETLQWIKTMGIAAPVVMITTKNRPDDIAQMLESGAADYLMKPFTLDILLGKIEMVCGRTFSHAA
jgi:two-component system chemotaxis response regulator CheY